MSFSGLTELNLNDAQFALYRERSRAFEKLAAHETTELALTGAGEPEVLTVARVTFEYFETLWQTPMHGRAFLP